MRISRLVAVLVTSGAIILLGLAVWALGAGSSDAQQNTMHNCPQAGKWAISVWDGYDGTDTGQALATCAAAPVDFAYYLDPASNNWLAYFDGQPLISKLLTLDDMQGVLAHGASVVATPTPTATPPIATPTETATPPGTPSPLACTHHVATSGSDSSPGTEQAPWQTIQHAADTAQPGDTVCVHAGSYPEMVSFTRSGTAGAAITFTAAPGETATVQELNLMQGASYLTLIGFTVRDFSFFGVDLWGNNHHVLLSHLDVAGGEGGIILESDESALVSDVVVEDSVISDAEYTAVGCGPDPCDRLTFRRLEIYGSGIEAGYGGDGLAVDRGQDILVEDCYVHDNGGDGIDLNSRDSAGNIPGIVVRRNRVVRNHLNGIKLAAGGRIENNVVWGQGRPVELGLHPGTFEVINNTIAYNMWSGDYGARDYAMVVALPETGTSAANQLTLVNNIFAFNVGPEMALDAPTGIYLGEGVQLTEHHNLYWSREDGEIEAQFVTEPGRDPPWFTRAEITDGTWNSLTGQGQGDVTADPLFVSGWPDVDLHLGAGSPAVDAGSADVAPSVDAEGQTRDSAPDIGAYER